MLQNAAPIHYPDFMFQYREAANFPWRSQAAWLYSQPPGFGQAAGGAGRGGGGVERTSPPQTRSS